MGNGSPTAFLLWAILSCIYLVFLLLHLWHYDRFACLRWDAGRQPGAFKRVMTYSYLGTVPLLVIFSVAITVIKFKEASPISKVSPRQGPSAAAILIAKYHCSHPDATSAIPAHRVCLAELTFWVFLLNQGPGKREWFASWEFRVWTIGCVATLTGMPMTVLATRQDIDTCLAYIFLVGSAAGTSTTLCFSYVLLRFPWFIRHVKAEGAEPDVVVRLATFYQLNIFFPRSITRESGYHPRANSNTNTHSISLPTQIHSHGTKSRSQTRIQDKPVVVEVASKDTLSGPTTQEIRMGAFRFPGAREATPDLPRTNFEHGEHAGRGHQLAQPGVDRHDFDFDDDLDDDLDEDDEDDLEDGDGEGEVFDVYSPGPTSEGGYDASSERAGPSTHGHGNDQVYGRRLLASSLGHSDSLTPSSPSQGHAPSSDGTVFDRAPTLAAAGPYVRSVAVGEGEGSVGGRQRRHSDGPYFLNGRGELLAPGMQRDGVAGRNDVSPGGSERASERRRREREESRVRAMEESALHPYVLHFTSPIDLHDGGLQHGVLRSRVRHQVV
ncbi:hypothetical protein H0H81_008133 [Sphagnurus paluster]|uniref:Uncharacterized protein n=1 Tax=Sphagnurus paluster TaxID=117069 RepID=A0A9P7FUB8_9AGAR|nr:hypothetical protein H0H81_008133 [Sphagnurus paluster]